MCNTFCVASRMMQRKLFARNRWATHEIDNVAKAARHDALCISDKEKKCYEKVNFIEMDTSTRIPRYKR